MSSGYRWWTIFGWHEAHDSGIKLGPVSVSRYQWDGPQWSVCVLNRRPIIDTGLTAHRLQSPDRISDTESPR